MNNVCRLCLSTDNLAWVFDKRLNSENNMTDVILIMTGVEMYENDVVSQMICKKCYRLSIRMFQFRKTSQKNDRYLKKQYEEIRKTSSVEHDIPDPGLRTETENKVEPKLKTKEFDKQNHRFHQSVRDLLKIYPRLKLPSICLMSNIDPCIMIEIEMEKFSKKETHSKRKCSRLPELESTAIDAVMKDERNSEVNNHNKEIIQKQSLVCVKESVDENVNEDDSFSEDDSDGINEITIKTKKRRLTDSDIILDADTNNVSSQPLPEKISTCESAEKLCPEESIPLFLCSMCNSVHNNVRELKRHQFRHLSCKFCRLKFKTMGLKKAHMQSLCAIKKIMNHLPSVKLEKIELDLKMRTKYPDAFIGYPPIAGLGLYSSSTENTREKPPGNDISRNQISQKDKRVVGWNGGCNDNNDDIIEILSDDDISLASIKETCNIAPTREKEIVPVSNITQRISNGVISATNSTVTKNVSSTNVRSLISTNNTVSSTTPLVLTPTPLVLTPTPPVISPTPPVISPTPSVISPTPSVISPTPVISPTLQVISTIPSVISPTPSVISPTPPVISSTPPVISPTPPVISPTPSVISPTPPVISPTPLVISSTSSVISTPSVLSTTPPVISTTPVVLYTNPLVISATPPVNSNTPSVISTTTSVTSTAPPVIPSTYPIIPLITPVISNTLSSVISTTPPVISPTPPVISTTPPAISSTPLVIYTNPLVISATPPVNSNTPPVISTTSLVTSTTPPVISSTCPVILKTPEDSLSSALVKPEIKIRNSTVLDTIDLTLSEINIFKELLTRNTSFKIKEDGFSQTELPCNKSISVNEKGQPKEFKNLKNLLCSYKIPILSKIGGLQVRYDYKTSNSKPQRAKRKKLWLWNNLTPIDVKVPKRYNNNQGADRVRIPRITSKITTSNISTPGVRIPRIASKVTTSNISTPVLTSNCTTTTINAFNPSYSTVPNHQTYNTNNSFSTPLNSFTGSSNVHVYSQAVPSNFGIVSEAPVSKDLTYVFVGANTAEQQSQTNTANSFTATNVQMFPQNVNMTSSVLSNYSVSVGNKVSAANDPTYVLPGTSIGGLQTTPISYLNDIRGPPNVNPNIPNMPVAKTTPAVSQTSMNNSLNSSNSHSMIYNLQNSLVAHNEVPDPVPSRLSITASGSDEAAHFFGSIRVKNVWELT